MHFEIYCAKDRWRWRAIRSGKIVAESGEAYTRLYDMDSAIRNFWGVLVHGFFVVRVIDVETKLNTSIKRGTRRRHLQKTKRPPARRRTVRRSRR